MDKNRSDAYSTSLSEVGNSVLKRKTRQVISALTRWRWRALPVHAATAPLIPILRYHSIDSLGSWISTSYDVWKEHLRYFRENRYEVVSLQDYFRGRFHDIHKVLIMTFDDGYINNYTHVFQDLKQCGYTATFFVVPGYAGKMAEWMERDLSFLLEAERELLDGNWRTFQNNARLNGQGIQAHLPQLLRLGRRRCLVEIRKLKSIATLPLMGWDELAQMKSAGMDIGAHTLTHVGLGQLEKGEALKEIRASKELIEKRLGTEVQFFCYPYGSLSERDIAMVKECGFLAACSCARGYMKNGGDPYSLRRVEMEKVGDGSDLDFYISPGCRSIADIIWRLGQSA